MYFVALRMLSADKAKYLGLVFAIAFSTPSVSASTTP
jgi:hypothetical protein